MSDAEQVDHFANELDNLVERFRCEYDLSCAAVVGVLHMKAWLICAGSANRPDDDAE